MAEVFLSDLPADAILPNGMVRRILPPGFGAKLTPPAAPTPRTAGPQQDNGRAAAYGAWMDALAAEGAAAVVWNDARMELPAARAVPGFFHSPAFLAYDATSLALNAARLHADDLYEDYKTACMDFAA